MPREMIALGFLGVAGNISPFILPVIVGALVDYGDFSIQRASYIASADMFGLGAGTLLWSYYIIRADWRKFALAAAVLLFAGNMSCALTGTFMAVLLSRFIAGIGGGLLIAIGVSGLAKTKNPDRVVAVYTLLVTVVASIILYVFPFLLVQSGSEGMFFTMAGFAVLAGVSGCFVPKYAAVKSGNEPGRNKMEIPSSALYAPLLTKVMGVLGVFMVFFSMSLFWVYIERAGAAAGYVTSQISAGLGTAQFTGVAGALTAAVVATRFGNRLAPILVTIGLSLVASITIPSTPEFVFFLLAASALIFSWNMLYPYVIGLMISLDETALLVTYALVMMTLGKSLSPVLGAFLVTEADFSMAYWACAICFVCAALLFMPAILLTDRKLKRMAPVV